MDNIMRIKTAIQNQLKEIDSITGINSLILSVCLVDTVAGFYCGYKGEPKGNKDRYLRFVTKYLNYYKDHLYDIRCNLAHSFSNTLSKFMFIDSPEYSKVFPNTEKILDWTIFNIDKFKNDLRCAIEQYFIELETSNDPELEVNFKTRFEYAGILEDDVIPTVRNLAGEMVKNYDDLDTLPGTNFKIAVDAPTKTKK